MEKATQHSQTVKRAIKLPIIKLKSVSLVQNKELKQQARLLLSKNSKGNVIIKKSESESNLLKSNAAVQAKKKVVVPTTLSDYFNNSSLVKSVPRGVFSMTKAATVANVKNSASETSNKNTGQGIKMKVSQEARGSKLPTKYRSCQCLLDQQITIGKTISASSHIPTSNKKNCRKCTNHKDFNEMKCDDRVKAGDIFPSVKDLFAYTNARGEKWMFYYKMRRSDNHLRNKRQRVTLGCCFTYVSAKYKARGLRKIKQYQTNCPCALLLYQLPNGHYQVMHACHHHDHELSSEMLAKLPSRYKYIGTLPDTYKDIRNEIYDLVSLGVDKTIIIKYMEDKIGLDLGSRMVNRHINYMKHIKRKRMMRRQFTTEKIKSLLLRIKEINEKYGPTNEMDVKEEQPATSQSTTNESLLRKLLQPTTSRSSTDEPLSLFKELLVEIRKSKRKAQELAALEESKKPKRPPKKKKRPPRTPSAEISHTNEDKSKLETAFETMTKEEEEKVMESVKELQRSVRDEMSPWHTQSGVQIQSFEEIFDNDDDYPVKVYATTDCHKSTGIVYTNDDYNVIAIQRHDIITGIDKEHSYSDSYDNNNICEEIVNSETEDQTDVDDGDFEMTRKYSRTELNKIKKLYFPEMNDPVVVRSIATQNYVDKSTQADLIAFDLERQIELFDEKTKELNKHRELQPYLTRLNDKIINKYNIDSEIVQSDVSEGIEYLSIKMSMPIMDILKHIYSGKAVLVRTKNSEHLNENVCSLYNYVPVRRVSRDTDIDGMTRDNYLEQYKNLCSLYSSRCFHLTNVVQSMNVEVDVLKRTLINNGKK